VRKTRRSKKRLLKPIIIILCEGEKTEPSYFSGFFRNTAHYKDYVFRPYQPTDHSPLGIVKAACEEKRRAIADKIEGKDIHVWAVFDRDGHDHIPEAFDMARANGIEIAFSNVCFEQWILLHYERTQKPFTNCDEIVSHIRSKHDHSYKKDDYCYDRLKENISTAIKNGEWLIQQVDFDISRGTPEWNINPYTDVHKLVTFLLSPVI